MEAIFKKKYLILRKSNMKYLKSKWDKYLGNQKLKTG